MTSIAQKMFLKNINYDRKFGFEQNFLTSKVQNVFFNKLDNNDFSSWNSQNFQKFRPKILYCFSKNFNCGIPSRTPIIQMSVSQLLKRHVSILKSDTFPKKLKKYFKNSFNNFISKWIYLSSRYSEWVEQFLKM